MADDQREFDIILWGATGFTGQLVAEYLLRQYGVAESLRWALGGRNQAKLERVRAELASQIDAAAGDLALVTGDSGDAASMNALAEQTRVVCTTVGPYALYGSKLVAACARAGTHYCDLAGEVHWIRAMIDEHHEQAAASGARIVPTCGFDSIPSDLGVLFLQREMQKRHALAATHIHGRVKAFSGAASGGTIASMFAMLEEARRDPSLMALMNDPYALNPKGERSGPDVPDARGPVYDEGSQQWTAPFVMAAINTKVVRRSAALRGYPYGKSFRYDEAMLTGPGPAGYAKAAGLSLATLATMGLAALGPTRRLLASQLPSPGEGPTREQQEAGFFDLRLWGEHPNDDGENLRVRVVGDRDPGYGSTSKMLGEAAVCLALDPLDSQPGLSTPAAAMGEPLLERLQAHAGVRFEVERA